MDVADLLPPLGHAAAIVTGSTSVTPSVNGPTTSVSGTSTTLFAQLPGR